MRLRLPGAQVYPHNYLRLNSVSIFPQSIAQRNNTRKMSSKSPSWLKPILGDHSRPPKLFAWDVRNLDKPLSRSDRFGGSDDDLGRRVFVLGIGNLGRLFASCLSQSPTSSPITLVVHRKELLDDWQSSEGIQIERDGVLSKNKNFSIEWWTDKAPENGPVREVVDGKKLGHLIIATKAAAAMPQVDRVRGYLDKNSTVMFAQNGMSKLWPPHGLSYVAHRFPSSNYPSFLACVTTHGVTSLGQFKSRHASPAGMSVGPLLINQGFSMGESFLKNQLLGAPFLDAKEVSRPGLWVLQLEKLVVNSIINPLTGVLRCKNGVLFERPDGVISKVIDQLLLELSKVLQALVRHETSASIFTDTGNSSENLGLTFSWDTLSARFSYDHLKNMLYGVGFKVRDNMSSMLQDVQAGKPTEIQDFNGWVIETASFLGQDLDVSGHRKLVDLIETCQVLDETELGRYFSVPVSAS